ncbi:MAG: flavin reductase family protein [Geminicoccaceae bacterium]
MAETELLASEAVVDETEFRKALSCFATGITILTTRDHRDRSRAMTVNTLTSVSLDPPLILYCLGKSAFHFNVFSKAEMFAVNVLRNDQQALSDRFAREQDDDLADLRTISLVTGSPILTDHLTVLDCTTHAKHEAGDHVVVLGRVRAIKHGPNADPLLYFKSQYRSFRPSAVG